MQNKQKTKNNNVNKVKTNTTKKDKEIVIGITTKSPNTEKKKNNTNYKQNKKGSKKKKSKKNNNNIIIIKTILKIICVLALIGGIIAFFMISPIFNITEIEVLNNEKLSKETYISLSGIKYGENIYRINKREITSKIKENAYVQSIQIKRSIPNKLIIEVEERKATYMIEIAGTYMYIDNQGYMLEISQEKLNTPVLKGIVTKEQDIKINNRLCEEDLTKLNKVLEIYKVAKSNDLNEIISEIDISDSSNYKLIIESENKNVYLGNATDLVNKFSWIKKIIETEKGKKGTIYADRNLSSQPVYFSPKK